MFTVDRTFLSLVIRRRDRDHWDDSFEPKRNEFTVDGNLLTYQSSMGSVELGGSWVAVVGLYIYIYK